MSNDVFISYSRRDLEFVTKLHKYLIDQGISAWFDQDSIQVGDQWRNSIVEGIRDCKVFILVLSPDSAVSVNVRKEVDLAERYKKRIIPLMWRQTEIPVAMEYQLAGIQYIDFQEAATKENLSKLTNVLHRLLGGAALSEVANDMEKGPVAPSKEESAPVSTGRGRGRGRTIRKKKTVSPVIIGGSVISGVVTNLGINPEDQDWINKELKWLFYASDNFLKIRQGDVDRDHAVPVSIPHDDEGNPISKSNNKLLSSLDDFDLQIWEGQIESGYTRINTHLRNLDILLDQETKKGDAGKGDVYLQNQIKGARSEIIKILREMAELMDQAYGVYVFAPEKLEEFVG